MNRLDCGLPIRPVFAVNVLTAKTSDGDSTAGNDTVRVQYTTTSSSSTDATMEYQVTIMV